MRLAMWREAWRVSREAPDPSPESPRSVASALLECQVDLLLCPVRIASNAVGRGMDPLACS